jgi:predicted RNA-binding protein with EMAP domain
VEPSFFPVIFPDWSTEAILALSLLQLAVKEAPSGDGFAVSAVVCPMYVMSVVFERETFVAKTVSLAVADLPFESFAVIVVEPAFFAFTNPSELTVAIALLPELQLSAPVEPSGSSAYAH